jgi:hypothetical protein
VRVNGTDLRRLVRAAYPALDQSAELDTAFLPLDEVIPPSGQWLGDPGAGLAEDGRAAVLVCACGDFGCGGVAARSTIDREFVTWSDFRWANSLDAVPIAPLRCDRADYEAALQDLRS